MSELQTWEKRSDSLETKQLFTLLTPEWGGGGRKMHF